MDFITNDHDMVRAAQQWAYTGTAKLKLTDDEKARIIERATSGTPGDIICNFAEYLYAHFDMLDDAGKTVMAQCFALAARNGWSGFNKDNRCSKVTGLVMGEQGVVTPIAFTSELPPEPHVHLRTDEVDWRIKTGIIKAPEPEVEPAAEPDAVAAKPAKATPST